MTLPPSCSVADLAAWLNPFWAPSATIFRESEAMARAVRALVEAKVREAVETTRNGQFDVALYNAAPVPTDTLVSRVLGGAS